MVSRGRILLKLRKFAFSNSSFHSLTRKSGRIFQEFSKRKVLIDLKRNAERNGSTSLTLKSKMKNGPRKNYKSFMSLTRNIRLNGI